MSSLSRLDSGYNKIYCTQIWLWQTMQCYSVNFWLLELCVELSDGISTDTGCQKSIQISYLVKIFKNLLIFAILLRFELNLHKLEQYLWNLSEFCAFWTIKELTKPMKSKELTELMELPELTMVKEFRISKDVECRVVIHRTHLIFWVLENSSYPSAVCCVHIELLYI